ncbi:phosphotransferase family protein [Actinophytocola sp. KF-1]
MSERTGTEQALSDEALSLLGTKVFGSAVTAVTSLPESVQRKAVRVRTDDGGDYTVTENVRGNSAPVEAALLRRLASVLPVPEPVYADDGDLLGYPILVKRFVAGQTVSSVLPTAAERDARDIAAAVGGVLAGIGTVGFDAPGEFTDTSLRPRPSPEFDLLALPAHVENRLNRPGAASHLDLADRRRLIEIVARDAAVLTAVRDQARLVHSDFNGKNIVVRQENRRWLVAAVLDWEFAFSGPPLTDVANHLRFPDLLPASYRNAFLDAFVAGGGVLEDDWERLARALDMFAVVDFLAAGPEHVFFAATLDHLRAIIARGHV